MDFDKFVLSILQPKEGNLTVKVESISNKWESLTGQVAIIDVTRSDKSRVKSLAVKRALTEKKLSIPIGHMYDNEAKFYETVVPALEKFMKDKKSNLSLPIPQFYGKHFDGQTKMIALGNLKEQGFEEMDRAALVGLSHANLVIKKYAVLHGVSMAFRSQNPTQFEQLTKTIVASHQKIVEDQYLQELFAIGSQDAGKVISTANGVSNEIVEKFAKYKTEAVKILKETDITKAKQVCIIHGDSWSSNVMFKNVGQEPKDLSFLDFQLVGVATPVYDLAYYLYSSGNKDVYHDVNKCLGVYHASLSEVVNQLGSNIETLYPFKTLQEDWKKYSKVGMIAAFVVHKMRLMDKTTVIDPSTVEAEGVDHITKTMKEAKYDEEEFKKRIKMLVEEVHKSGNL